MSSLTRSRRRSRTVLALVLAVLAAVGVRLSAQQQVVPGTNVNMVSGTTFPGRRSLPAAAERTDRARSRPATRCTCSPAPTTTAPSICPARSIRCAASRWTPTRGSACSSRSTAARPGRARCCRDSRRTSRRRASPRRSRGVKAATDPVMRVRHQRAVLLRGRRVRSRRQQAERDLRGALHGPEQPSRPAIRSATSTRASSTATAARASSTRSRSRPTFRAPPRPARSPAASATSRRCTDRARPDDSRRQRLRRLRGVHRLGRDRAVGDHVLAVDQLRRRPGARRIALSTGSRLVQNPQIAVSPVDGAVYVSWRRFKYPTQDDAVMVVKSINGGATFGKPLRVSGVRPVRPGHHADVSSGATASRRWRSTRPAACTWRGRTAATRRCAAIPATGDSRIVISTSATGATWTVPRAIQPAGVGHQLMPALTFHGGKLRILYYDLREDVSQLFGPYIDELPILTGPTPRIRHTMDVFVGAGAARQRAGLHDRARLRLRAAGSCRARPSSSGCSSIRRTCRCSGRARCRSWATTSTWRRRRRSCSNDDRHVGPTTPARTAARCRTRSGPTTATCGAPADGNWANYTPVTSTRSGPRAASIRPSRCRAAMPGQVGMRNQNIYTARVTDGLFVSAPGNNKPFNGFQRAFVVVAENAVGGAAHLPAAHREPADRRPGVVPAVRPAADDARRVDAGAVVGGAHGVRDRPGRERAHPRVGRPRSTAPGGAVVAGGLTGTVVLNPDPQNPSLQNPVAPEPVAAEPVLQNIAQGESYNPGITQRSVGVPNLQNPACRIRSCRTRACRTRRFRIRTCRTRRCRIRRCRTRSCRTTRSPTRASSTRRSPNPSLQNPILQNPSLQNPSLQNVDLTNAGFSDTNWVITNEGNTTASYTVNLLLNDPVPAGFATQLLLHKTFKTPAADGCTLKEQAHTILLANIPNPQFVTDPTNPSLQNPSLQNPSLQNPTLALAPGESATITFRVVDPNIFDGVDLRRLGRGDAGRGRAVGQHGGRRRRARPRRRSRCR